MTRDEMITIIAHDVTQREYRKSGGFNEAIADRILTALEKEREGEEVVYEKITVEADGCLSLSDTEYLPTSSAGKTGFLIFRPDTKKEN